MRAAEARRTGERLTGAAAARRVVVNEVRLPRMPAGARASARLPGRAMASESTRRSAPTASAGNRAARVIRSDPMPARAEGARPARRVPACLPATSARTHSNGFAGVVQGRALRSTWFMEAMTRWLAPAAVAGHTGTCCSQPHAVRARTQQLGARWLRTCPCIPPARERAPIRARARERARRARRPPSRDTPRCCMHAQNCGSRSPPRTYAASPRAATLSAYLLLLNAGVRGFAVRSGSLEPPPKL